ncbi:hypothetical protein PVAP13_6KG128900 [Panicum virgatum]|uniref:Uncharacterized protein n=1 Tax=Panicum virgatum TaxID=38727 RepID=A0A8T0RI68_PANVG|nr:hypothetical protein PVAP13_6KG128900 [Panicum virgatum]
MRKSVQIKGILPKWCDWTTVKEVASSLGKLVEVDWLSLFNSSFSMIRVRLMCKNPQKIPMQRIVEMSDKLYLLTFKAEGIIQDQKPSEGGDKGAEDGEEGDEDLDNDDLLGEDLGGEWDPTAPNQDGNRDNDQAPSGNDKPGEGSTLGGRGKAGGKLASSQKGSVKNCLQMDQFADNEGLSNCSNQIPRCINLLQAMELEGQEVSSEAEQDEEQNSDNELMQLPDDWVYALQSKSVSQQEMTYKDELETEVASKR